jgi:solute carrier family 50 (sugar transporter)
LWFSCIEGLALVNAISWCMYAIMLEDYYIFVANSPGVVCGTYCVVSSLVIMGQSKRGFSDFNYRVLESILLGGITFFLVLGMAIGIAMSSWDKSLKDTVVAVVANSACVMYYGAPCSSMYEVIMSKDSSSLHLPMIFVNFLNAILWSVYGYFALNDLFVVVPNTIGLGLSVLQLCLIVLYPASDGDGDSDSAGAGDGAGADLEEESLLSSVHDELLPARKGDSSH